MPPGKRPFPPLLALPPPPPSPSPPPPPPLPDCHELLDGRKRVGTAGGCGDLAFPANDCEEWAYIHSPPDWTRDALCEPPAASAGACASRHVRLEQCHGPRSPPPAPPAPPPDAIPVGHPLWLVLCSLAAATLAAAAGAHYAVKAYKRSRGKRLLDDEANQASYNETGDLELRR